jgi:site-specific DNA recombinase
MILRPNSKNAPPVIRCAVYTRKSTEEGLDREFNSLDAQRESGEAYIKSQAAEGWVCLAERYDDGGFSGGTIDRPALQRLLKDIGAGKIDTVVVYKVDRLSRSLLDFAKIIELFDRYKLSFVSVTQLINTSSSIGRLMLNVLLSFAQFEREIVGERTRDKIAAARRKGKWSGGMPLLGYDVDPNGSKLRVNEVEAERVRAIFRLYLECQSIVETIANLDSRGWVNKRWTARDGAERGGRKFNKSTLHHFLTNVVYLAKVKYKDEVHAGEHEAIIDEEVWRQVQAILERNHRGGGSDVRNKYGALLKGLLRCTACNSAMTPTHAKKGATRYRYYCCVQAQKRGWSTCPAKSIPAPEIEKLVVEQVRLACQNPQLIESTIEAVRAQSDMELASLRSELGGLDQDIARWSSELQKVTTTLSIPEDSPLASYVADLNERIRGAEARAAELRTRRTALSEQRPNAQQVIEAIRQFDDIWSCMSPLEQTRLVQSIVERVDYDGTTGNVAIKFRASGFQDLANKLAKAEDAA